MRLKVLSRYDKLVSTFSCWLERGPVSQVAVPQEAQPAQVIIPLQEGRVVECPDLQDAAKMAESEPTVTWYHVFEGGLVRHPHFRFQV